MYILSDKRQAIVSTLFSDDAWSTLDECFDDKRTIDDRMKRAYIEQIKLHYQNQQQTQRFHRLRKSPPSLPYSIFMINDEPFLVLPTPPEWKKRKQSNAAPKTLVSLTSGEMKFLKTYRPTAALSDNYPEEASLKDFKNRQQWGEETELLARSTLKGKKYYLLMPHYGKSLDALEKDASITPRLILSALSQAAAHIKTWHDKGILHLDIKPSNIMYESNTDKARLIDFETMMPDTSLVRTARGTHQYMHPERLMYDGRQWVAKTGNITCCKNEDVFCLLRTIEDMLLVAIKKEFNPSCKAALTVALKQFRNEAYCKFNADGTGTHAFRLHDIASIDAIKLMMDKTFEGYDNMALETMFKVTEPQVNPQAYPNNPSPRPNYTYPAYGNNLSPRPNYTHQAYAHPSPRVNYAYQAYANPPSPRVNYAYQAFPQAPSPRLSNPNLPQNKPWRK